MKDNGKKLIVFRVLEKLRTTIVNKNKPICFSNVVLKFECNYD